MQPPKAPPIKFATDDKSLADNAGLLEEFDFDIAKLLDHFADTTIGCGSKFWPTKKPQKIFGGHPDYGFFKETLQTGMDYFFDTKIFKEQRVLEIQANLERGNHKSATSKPEITEKTAPEGCPPRILLPFSIWNDQETQRRSCATLWAR